jgi:hypothetical protein
MLGKKFPVVLLLSILVIVLSSCGIELPKTDTQELAEKLKGNDRVEIVYFGRFDGYNGWVTIFKDKETGTEIFVTDSGITKLN